MADRNWGMNFTVHAEEQFFDTVDDPLFHSEDRSLIYEALQEKLRPIQFGDYLMRYIYEKAGRTDPFAEVPLSFYQQVIAENFTLTGTPVSFGESKLPVRTMAKNWLTQHTVSRQVVLLLGFGLRMTPEEVNEFLTKALHEHRLSPKDPLEVVCRFCYQHKLPYARFLQLCQENSRLTPGVSAAPSERTVLLEGIVRGMQSEQELKNYLRDLIAGGAVRTQGATARAHFNELYARAQELTARYYNAMASEDLDVKVERLRDALEHSDRFFAEQKRELVGRMQQQSRSRDAASIGPADMEKLLCASIPVRKDGNYLPIKESRLYRQFEGKRFHRKHIHEIFAGRALVTRFDLITMNFYCSALDLNPEQKIIARYGEFVRSTNALLNDSSMGSLYLANPYECFVLMCMLSEDPLGTYADVWELSYEEAQPETET